MTTDKDDDLAPEVVTDEDSQDSEQETTMVETGMLNNMVTFSGQEANTRLPSSSYWPAIKEKRYYKQTLNSLIDQTQSSGRLAPVFGPPTIKSEEDYIRRMIEKDKKNNRG